MEKSYNSKKKSVGFASLTLSKGMSASSLHFEEGHTYVLCHTSDRVYKDLWIDHSRVTSKGLPMIPTLEPKKTENKEKM